MSKAPRHSSTYRGARKNGSGAILRHSPVPSSMIKVRHVQPRPLLPPQERKAVLGSIRRHRAKLRALFGVAMPQGGRITSKASPPFTGKLRLGVFSSVRKVMRAARRGELTFDVPSAAEIAKHDWSRRPLAART